MGRDSQSTRTAAEQRKVTLRTMNNTTVIINAKSTRWKVKQLLVVVEVDGFLKLSGGKDGVMAFFDKTKKFYADPFKPFYYGNPTDWGVSAEVSNGLNLRLLKSRWPPRPCRNLAYTQIYLSICDDYCDPSSKILSTFPTLPATQLSMDNESYLPGGGWPI